MSREKGKKLTLDDRIVIAAGLAQKKTLAAIAKELDAAPSTVYREVKTNRTEKRPWVTALGDIPNYCIHKTDCSIEGLCSDDSCTKRCKYCQKLYCSDLCCQFEETVCPKLVKAPYVCNACTLSHTRRCSLRHFAYQPKDADRKSQRRRRDARSGIDLDPEKGPEIIERITLLLKKGQSPAHIWSSIGSELPFSERTFYRYVENSIYGLTAFNLNKKIRYKKRKIHYQLYRNLNLSGREYGDWLGLNEVAREASVQIDCIKGRHYEQQAILSLHFVALKFQIYMPLEREDASCVSQALDALELYCEGKFPQYFAILLADRGSGFLDYPRHEIGIDGKKRCRMYFCDARHPEQKGSAEKNHVEFRKIVPKGSEIKDIGANELALIMSHVNSYKRKSLGGKSPIELASQILPKSLLDALGIAEIDPEKVCLKPELLED